MASSTTPISVRTPHRLHLRLSRTATSPQESHDHLLGFREAASLRCICGLAPCVYRLLRPLMLNGQRPVDEGHGSGPGLPGVWPFHFMGSPTINPTQDKGDCCDRGLGVIAVPAGRNRTEFESVKNPQAVEGQLSVSGFSGSGGSPIFVRRTSKMTYSENGEVSTEISLARCIVALAGGIDLLT